MLRRCPSRFLPCLDVTMSRRKGGHPRAGNVHVVVGVLGVASASEFDKGVAGSRECFVERSSFDGIGLEERGTGTRAQNDGIWGWGSQAGRVAVVVRTRLKKSNGLTARSRRIDREKSFIA